MASSSPRSTASRKDDKKKRKGKKVPLSEQKDDARREAEVAATRASQVVIDGHSLYKTETTGRLRQEQLAFKLASHDLIHKPRHHGGFRLGMPSMNMHMPNCDGSVSSETSNFSTELAVRRGSTRALIERNESSVSVARSHLPDLDLTSATEASTRSSPSKRKKGKFKKISVFKRKKIGSGSHASKRSKGRFKMTHTDSMLNGEITRDAWMCGCCGKAFSSLNAAERHEDKCIRAAIARLELEEGSPLFLTTPSGVTQGWNQTLVHTPSARGANFTPTNGTPAFNGASTPAQLPVQDSSSLDDFHSVDSAPPSVDAFAAPDPFFGIPEEGKTIRFLFDDPPDGDEDADDLLLTNSMREYISLTDEALVNTVFRAQPLIVSYDEIESERELALLANDKFYYDLLEKRSLERNALKGRRFRTNRKGALSKVQNRFADTYQYIKEGDASGDNQDQYSRKVKGKDNDTEDITHDDNTLYINVIVRNSVRVVENELHRLAKVRWEDTNSNPNEDNTDDRFEKFRAMAQSNVVKLAGLALASDFTPRRIAVQLSNDLYRLMAPQLRRRGIEIETEIEYRVGPFFVLSVNLKTVDWIKVMKITHYDVAKRRKQWRLQKQRREEALHGDAPTTAADNSTPSDGPEEENIGFVKWAMRYMYNLSRLTQVEMIAQMLAWLYYLHWLISVPICKFMYLFIPSSMRSAVITAVTDEIFYYVEEKGMEMEIKVEVARKQAAFMLSALREIRADDRSLKKKRKETKAGIEGEILGPLLGPAIKADKGPANPPPNFTPPENLEFVGLEIDLPVGFQRIRWAMLNSKSVFIKDAVWSQESGYENIEMGEWSKHSEEIGLPNLPDGVKCEDFVGAEMESSYLMPKSAFVAANTAYEKATIQVYNDYCICLKKQCRTPDVPYGSTFIAWTQYTITNTGNDTCHMVCSTEAEFPNGPPMVGRQIKSGMRAGTAELFVKIGETVCKYADEYP